MALHALALAAPGDWPRIAVAGRDWLWSKQNDDGSWDESGAPGPAFLTVLVLDAIALTDGSENLTFHNFPNAAVHPSNPSVQGVVTEVPESNHSGTAGDPAVDRSETETMMSSLDTGEARRAAIESYREEVLKKKGTKITKADIWREARYKSRTEFERWERGDHRANKTAHQRFCRILVEKPHLK